MDWDTLLMHCTPVQEVKKAQKEWKWEIVSASDSNYWRCQDISSSQHFWQAGHKSLENLKFWRVFAALVHSIHTKIFWRLRVATFIYTLHSSAPQAWWDDEGSTTYLAESSGGRLASPPPNRWNFPKCKLKWYGLMVQKSGDSPVDMENIPKKNPGGLLRSSKNHEQYQAASSFFHRQCQRRSKRECWDPCRELPWVSSLQIHLQPEAHFPAPTNQPISGCMKRIRTSQKLQVIVEVEYFKRKSYLWWTECLEIKSTVPDIS